MTPAHPLQQGLTIRSDAPVWFVTDPAQIGRSYMLVSKAGQGCFAVLEEGEDAEIRRRLEANVFGLAALTRRVLPGMRERRAGHIFNYSPVVGKTAHPTPGDCCATRFAAERLSESLAKEVAPLGIKVTRVEPSGFCTDRAGRSARTPQVEIRDYALTVSHLRCILAEDSGTRKGDPERAAAMLIEVAAPAAPRCACRPAPMPMAS